MKIININKEILTRQLFHAIEENLNPIFQQQREIDMAFLVKIVDNVVEISGPEHYEGFLFRIKINGTELCITRSENYVDDVNSLTIESIFNGIFEKLSGVDGVVLVLEG